MDVGDKDVFDFLLRGQVERRSGGAGVDQKGIVDQKGGKIKTRQLPSRAAEDAKFHRSNPFSPLSSYSSGQ
jgi:hypothetical protein